MLRGARRRPEEGAVLSATMCHSMPGTVGCAVGTARRCSDCRGSAAARIDRRRHRRGRRWSERCAGSAIAGREASIAIDRQASPLPSRGARRHRPIEGAAQDRGCGARGDGRPRRRFRLRHRRTPHTITEALGAARKAVRSSSRGLSRVDASGRPMFPFVHAGKAVIGSVTARAGRRTTSAGSSTGQGRRLKLRELVIAPNAEPGQRGALGVGRGKGPRRHLL